MSARTEKPKSKSRQLRDAAKKAEEHPNKRGAKRAKCGTLLSTYLDREKGRSTSFREEEEEEENASSLRVHAEVGSSARVAVVMEAVRREEVRKRDGTHDARPGLCSSYCTHRQLLSVLSLALTTSSVTAAGSHPSTSDS
jgi:hypothetical protein